MLEEIGEFCSIERFSEGNVIFKDGEDGNALFVVKEGEVAVSRQLDTGQKQEIARYIAGDSFGELDMMMQTARNAEARAFKDCALLRFPRPHKSLQDLLSAYPATGARLLHSFLGITAGRIRKANILVKENTPWVQEMRNQVYRDKLTGLFNKTFLTEQLPSYLKDEPLSLLMVKPDNFKEINDTYGHESGDEALIVMASALNRHAPETVEICRFAGNELACVFPGADKEKARQAAVDIREMMNNLDLSAITGASAFRLSVSIGIAVYPDYSRNAGELIALAHELPLIGRDHGGNKILFPEDK
jgi:diguanylate cyclase (GGDEF)-like protein